MEKNSELNFKVGDVVKLKSGGPDLTVRYVIGSDSSKDFDFIAANYKKNDLVCRWFENDALEENIFEPETIIKTDK
jgi:uncharacterized protein YodC (DUF2158 family)